MPRSTDAFAGRAEFAAQVAKVKGVPVEGVECRLVRLGEDGPTLSETTETYAFRLLGVGFDEAVFFVARDVTREDEARFRPLWAASEATFGAMLPGTDHATTRGWAAEAAIKFVLRIPEEERAAAWERMRAFGADWRARL